MQVRILDTALAELPCRTRLPFRFGAVTVTTAPLLHARVVVETTTGDEAVGIASDLLVPRWFRKDVERSPAEDQRALRDSAQAAALRYRGHGFRPVFEHWRSVHEHQVENLPAHHPERLERGFGVALFERALLDATCRALGLPFFAALQQGVLGQRLLLNPDGRWQHPQDLLPERPLAQIAVRHTVGRLDPLRAADIPPDERLADGMPQALDEVLQRHGVRWLKVKIGGGHDADRQRLCAIGRLLRELRADVQVTLDGNEQFRDFGQLRELWRATGDDPDGKNLLQRVRWVEQPLPRGPSLLDGGPCDPRHWTYCPLVLDEGDTGLMALPGSGYHGVSVKNCKGVFRALATRELCAAPELGLFQTAEDLTNLPVVALQQDLLTAAVLGLEHAERNGHHYFPGLAHLPRAAVDAALLAHPDLYERTEQGAKLRIQDGQLQIASLGGTGYGVAQEVVDALDRSLPWRAIA